MSGAGSTPSGMGLAPTPHAREGNLPARFCLVQRGFCFAQRGEEASWPARGGNVAGSVESRRVHAAASLRVRTAAMPCGRAGIPTRDPSSMEGVLVRRGLLPLTRRRGEAGLAARRTQSSAFPRKGPWLCPSGRDRGRQRPRHEPGSRPRTPRPGGTARRSYRSKLRQDRVVPSSTRALGAQAPHARDERSWAMAEAGGSPSSDAPPVGRLEVQRLKADRCRSRERAPRGALLGLRTHGNRMVRAGYTCS
jgi:hypothetical protein